MPTGRTKASSSGLGKAIINRKARDSQKPVESKLYTLDEGNPLQSITQERDLDEFLANAALADADFTTERSRARIIAGPSTAGKNPFLLSADEEKDVKRKQARLQGDLRVPRRPAWNRSTTRPELEKQERESFLDWRRSLAQLAESSSLLMTPFERNIQLWRQLWRVLERSHLVVQIVDARNPLGFRCGDLEEYVKEIGQDGEDGEEDEEEVTIPGRGKRRSLLLINKADLLTEDQRERWAEYFESQGIQYAFFSAADAAAAQEQAEKMRRRQEELDASSDEDEDEDEDGDDVETEDAHDEEEEDDEAALAGGEEIDPDEELAASMQQADFQGEEEEGWSTEGEGEDEEGDGSTRRALDNGRHVPLSEVARQVASGESDRTRVLSVVELEDLFMNAAPDLAEFATSRNPHPTKLIVGLVGYPNVGKSSTINALLGSKKVSVSATPGKTKHFQTLVLSDQVTLCDCPGLVFPQFASTQADMILDGVLPIDQMKEYSAPADLVCDRVPREILEGTYGIRIDVKAVEEGGTGKVTWEDFLSTYAIARGLTRSSFGMPDTSRAARHVLKDYVNARLLYAHPPPDIAPDDFMRTSRERTVARLEAEYEQGRKRAPTTHVGRNADTYVPPSSTSVAAESADVDPSASASAADSGSGPTATSTARERQLTSRQVRASAASAPMRSGREKAEALDNVYFNDVGPAPRPVVKGRHHGGDRQDGGLGFARPMQYAHQRMLGPDGMPLVQSGQAGQSGAGGANGEGAGWGVMGGGKKKHFKVKEGKKRSGRGYD